MMTMFKNWYRRVEYVDDGVDEFQCLSCKERFGLRYGAINYCMVCGIKFGGELKCRPHETPAWAWNRYKGEVPYEVYDKMYPKRVQLNPNWVIECRTTWPNSRRSEWKYERCCKDYTGKEIAATLKYLRDTHDDVDSYIQFEYRAMIE